MINEEVRCKNCGRPLNKDEQENFFSYCYDCFRNYKSSRMRKATAMRIIGIVGLLFVCIYIFLFSSIFSVYGFERPLRVMVFIIGCIIALLIPSLLIISGTQKKREWSRIFKSKPILPQEVIYTSDNNTTPVQKKFCPQCGTMVEDQNQKFCVNCGNEF